MRSTNQVSGKAQITIVVTFENTFNFSFSSLDSQDEAHVCIELNCKEQWTE